MDPPVIVSRLGQGLAALAFAWAVFAGYRWIRRRSEVLGTVVAIAVITRLTTAVAMFWVSYLSLPLVESLQDFGGFWRIALDATGYYELAGAAVESGLFYSLDDPVPSPVYLNMLVVWMTAVGVSPASAAFLNLCLYMTLIVLMVRQFDPVNDWRRDLPCIVGVVAYSFSPVILFHSTQPLKDELSLLLTSVACLGVLALGTLINGSSGRRYAWVIGAAAVALAVFGATGIRWYYGCILWGSLALTLGIFTFRGRSTALPRYLAGSAAVLVTAWLAFWAGAGPAYHQIAPSLWSVGDVPAELLNLTQMARLGFLTSGGNTNIVVPLRDDPNPGLARADQLREAQQTGRAYVERDLVLRETRKRAQSDSTDAPPSPDRRAEALREQALRAEHQRAVTQRAEAERLRAERLRTARLEREPAIARVTLSAAEAAPVAEPSVTAAPAPAVSAPEPPATLRAVPTNLREQLRTVLVGLAIIFVPLSLVRTIVDVEFSGGRGLLSIVDLDTIYLDLAILLVIALLWKRRHAIGDRLPFVVFGIILSATTAVLLGYVVTNFGTLWRLRPLIAVPLWILVVALSPRSAIEAEGSDVRLRDVVAT
jgi:hypothetical protein